MYIQSKLKNTEVTLFSLDLSIVNQLETKSIQLQPNDWLEVSCELQYHRDFCIVDTSFKNTKELVDVYSIKGDYVQVSLVSKGSSQIENSSAKQNIAAGNIQFTHQKSSSWEILMPANEPTHYISIILSKSFYLELLQNENWVNADAVYNKVKANKLIEIGEDKFPISFSIHQILNQLTRCEFPNEYKQDYFKLKLKELFYVYFIQQKIQSPRAQLADETFEKVKKAKAYLAIHFNNPPTIKQLSRQVLLNEQKLKSAFKEVFGITIRGYVIQLKMKKALTLLEKHTVYEISNILGYKSTSHFINMFKKHYGYTPKQALKK